MPTAPDPADDLVTPVVSRRSALKVGGGGALALVLGATAGWVDRRGDSRAPTAVDSPPAETGTSTTTSAPVASPVVIPDVGDVDPAIVVVGRRVIEITGEADIESLLAKLPPGEGDPLELAAATVRDDFLASRTTIVDGWVLAESEARAAAIVALLCDRASC